MYLVDVLLKAAGDAPIMKKKKWAVSGNKTVAFVVEFIRKRIKCSPAESLVLLNMNKVVKTIPRKWTSKFSFLCIVSLCQPVLCALPRPTHPEPLWGQCTAVNHYPAFSIVKLVSLFLVFRCWWEIGSVLLQDSSLGMIRKINIFSCSIATAVA